MTCHGKLVGESHSRPSYDLAVCVSHQVQKTLEFQQAVSAVLADRHETAARTRTILV